MLGYSRTPDSMLKSRSRPPDPPPYSGGLPPPRPPQVGGCRSSTPPPGGWGTAGVACWMLKWDHGLGGSAPLRVLRPQIILLDAGEGVKEQPPAWGKGGGRPLRPIAQEIRKDMMKSVKYVLCIFYIMHSISRTLTLYIYCAH